MPGFLIHRFGATCIAGVPFDLLGDVLDFFYLWRDWLDLVHVCYCVAQLRIISKLFFCDA